MGRTYTIYAEVRVGDNWYNICPLRKSENGKLTVLPIAEGRSWLKNAADEIEEYSYAHGRPSDLSEDLRAGILRCVGDAEKRFNEDAVRILRCLRFAARPGFWIHPDTQAALKNQVRMLDMVFQKSI